MALTRSLPLYAWAKWYVRRGQGPGSAVPPAADVTKRHLKTAVMSRGEALRKWRDVRPRSIVGGLTEERTFPMPLRKRPVGDWTARKIFQKGTGMTRPVGRSSLPDHSSLRLPPFPLYRIGPVPQDTAAPPFSLQDACLRRKLGILMFLCRECNCAVSFSAAAPDQTGCVEYVVCSAGAPTVVLFARCFRLRYAWVPLFVSGRDSSACWSHCDGGTHHIIRSLPTFSFCSLCDDVRGRGVFSDRTSPE